MRKTANYGRYYVYLGPGNISYFDSYDEAVEYAEANDAQVQYCDI